MFAILALMVKHSFPHLLYNVTPLVVCSELTQVDVMCVQIKGTATKWIEVLFPCLLNDETERAGILL